MAGQKLARLRKELESKIFFQTDMIERQRLSIELSEKRAPALRRSLEKKRGAADLWRSAEPRSVERKAALFAYRQGYNAGEQLANTTSARDRERIIRGKELKIEAIKAAIKLCNAESFAMDQDLIEDLEPVLAEIERNNDYRLTVSNLDMHRFLNRFFGQTELTKREQAQRILDAKKEEALIIKQLAELRKRIRKATNEPTNSEKL